MNDRFKFNAIVSSWYDIDTPEDYQEFEPTFYLKNVDAFCTGEIGIDYDTLLDAVKEQSKDLAEKEIGQIMQHFEDNSNSPECDFVTITPDKILQCTGLKDKNGKLIYEGDVVKVNDKVTAVIEFYRGIFGCRFDRQYKIFERFLGVGAYSDFEIEVIGNIYQDSHLIEN